EFSPFWAVAPVSGRIVPMVMLSGLSAARLAAAGHARVMAAATPAAANLILRIGSSCFPNFVVMIVSPRFPSENHQGCMRPYCPPARARPPLRGSMRQPDSRLLLAGLVQDDRGAGHVLEGQPLRLEQRDLVGARASRPC